MATRFLDKEFGASTTTAIADDATGRLKVRNLPDAAGIAFDSVDGFIKYNDGGTIRTLVNTDEVQTLTNKTISDISGYRQERVVAYDITGAALHAANLTAFTAPAACIITRAILNITTASTGASTIDIGITATTATTSSDTLLDGVSGTPAAAFDSADAGLDTGANDMAQPLASGKWVTVDEASGDATGMVATLFIYYILA